jgi:hypothetical protein
MCGKYVAISQSRDISQSAAIPNVNSSAWQQFNVPTLATVFTGKIS